MSLGRDFLHKVNAATDEMVKNTTHLGAEVGKARFSAHSAAYDLPMPKVLVDINRHTGRVYMIGDEILFQEFGTGIGAVHPDGSTYGFTPGSWSRTFGTGQFAEKGYWYYKKTKWVGVPPAMAWYEAYKQMKLNYARFFEEAWNK